MTGVFVQARVKSKRLKDKMFLPLGKEYCILEHCLRAAKLIRADVYALLVPKDEMTEFEEFAEREVYELFGGDENDVLKRFATAIDAFKVDDVIRITGDKVVIANPFIDEMVEMREAAYYDLIHYNESPLKTTTGGVFSSRAILMANLFAKEKSDREHVKPFIERNERFKVKTLPIPYWLQKIDFDFTIDTEEDYNIMNRMFEEIYDGLPMDFFKAVDWVSQLKDKLVFVKE